MPVKPLVIESIGSKRVVNKTYYDLLEAASVNAADHRVGLGHP